MTRSPLRIDTSLSNDASSWISDEGSDALLTQQQYHQEERSSISSPTAASLRSRGRSTGFSIASTAATSSASFSADGNTSDFFARRTSVAPDGTLDANSSGGNKAVIKPERKVSLSLLFQCFLIVSLSLIVFSTMLLFKFFAIEAIDRIGTMYMVTAAEEVETKLNGLFASAQAASVYATFAPNAFSSSSSSSSGQDEQGAAATMTMVEKEHPRLLHFNSKDDFWDAATQRMQELVLMYSDVLASAATTLGNGTQVYCDGIATGSCDAQFTECGDETVVGLGACRKRRRDFEDTYERILKVEGGRNKKKDRDTSDRNNNNTNTKQQLSILMDAFYIWQPTYWPNNTVQSLTLAAIYNISIRSRGPSHSNNAEQQQQQQQQQQRVLFQATIPDTALRRVLEEIHVESSHSVAAFITDASLDSQVVLSSYSHVPEGGEIFVGSPDPNLLVDVGPGGQRWRVSVAAGRSVVADLHKGQYLVIAVSITFTVAICIAGVMLLRLVLTPLAKLRADMVAAIQLRFDAIRQRSSFIREINDMVLSFSVMAARLRSYKPLLLELREESLEYDSMLHQAGDSAVFGDDMMGSFAGAAGESGGASPTAAAAQHLVRVSLSKLSRRNPQLVKKVVNFEHTYTDGDEEMFDKFVLDCLRNLQEHAFEVVTLHIQSRQRMVLVKSNSQLEQVISASPGGLQVTIQESSKRTLLSPFALLVDFSSFSLNVLLIFLVIFSPATTRPQKLSIFVFSGLYFFALVVNTGISLWLLKRGRRFPKLREWLGQAAMEVSLILLLCALNTQHIHFLWSHWKFGGVRFNAPRIVPVWRMCVRWSMFGFVFSDLMQILYKTFRLYESDQFTALTSVCLVMSMLAVVMGLPKKVSLFAIARRKRKRKGRRITGNDARYNNNSNTDENDDGDGGDDDDDDDDAQDLARSRSGTTETLYSSEATLVLFKIDTPSAARSARRVTLDATAFYSTVLACVKSNDGTVIYFHGTDALAIFNAPRLILEHCSKAAMCALECHEELRKLHINVHCAIATDDMPVGRLGSRTNKSFQCIYPLEQLQRMVWVGRSRGAQVIATRKCSPFLANAPVRMTALRTPMEEGSFVQLRHRAIFSGLSASGATSSGDQDQRSAPFEMQCLAPFGIAEPNNKAMRRLGSFLERWLQDHTHATSSSSGDSDGDDERGEEEGGEKKHQQQKDETSNLFSSSSSPLRDCSSIQLDNSAGAVVVGSSPSAEAALLPATGSSSRMRNAANILRPSRNARRRCNEPLGLATSDDCDEELQAKLVQSTKKHTDDESLL